MMEALQPDAWRQWLKRCMPQVTAINFVPWAGTPFQASLKLPLGAPGIVQCRFSAGHFVRESARDNADAFLLAIEEAGTANYEYQQGRSKIQATRNDAVLIPDIALSVGSPAGFGGIGISLLRADFEARGVRPHEFTMRRIMAQSEGLGLLRACVRLIGQTRATGAPPPALREIFLRHIHDLAALAVSWPGAVGESSMGAVTDTRLCMALAHIAAHFHEPHLTIEDVARQQGVSPRYLQRLMESCGRSYTAEVNEMRLQKVHAALTAGAPGSILELAMQSGFANLSHFNRLFRHRFGDSPSGVRATATGGKTNTK